MAKLEYLNFDLSLEGSEGRYRARVLDSPVGQADGEFTEPFSEQELNDFFEKIGQPRLIKRGPTDPPRMQEAKQFGGRLFSTVFTGNIYTCFRDSLNKAQAQGNGLRLRLRVNTPELNNLPWEYLYNARGKQFLSWSNKTPIVRYLQVEHPPRALGVKPPLRILTMISSPRGYPRLDVESEWQHLIEALAKSEERDLIRLERLERATLSALQRRLRGEDVHMLHFIGHGRFAQDEGLLLFEGEDGRGLPMSGEYLGSLLVDHSPLRLVVLNACEGARTGHTDPFSGVAQTLVVQGIPAVVAMQFEITDRSAITFAKELYGSLADGYPVDAALAEARKAVFFQGSDIEWGAPVYFARAPNGRIFDITKVSTTDAPPIMDPDLEKHLERVYLDGLSAFWLGDWETAQRCFREVAGLHPDYQDAGAKLADVEQQIEIVGLYEQAQEAMQAKNWMAAKKALEKLESKAPGYKDTADLLEEARKQRRLAELYDQARQLCQGKRWQAVIGVFERIHASQADYPDGEGLLACAERGLALEKHKWEVDDLHRRALGAMETKEWERAVAALEQLLELDAKYPNVAGLLVRARLEQEKVEGAQRLVMLLDEAQAATGAQEWERAIGVLQSLLKIAPNHFQAGELLALARSEQERRAREAQFAALMEAASVARVSQDWDLAIEKLEAVLDLMPEHTEAQAKLDEARQQRELVALYRQTQQQRREGRLEAALEGLERILAIEAGYRDAAKQAEALRDQVAAWPAKAPARRRVSAPGYAWVILAVVYLTTVSSAIVLNKVAPVMSVLDGAFAITLPQAGLLISVFGFTALILALPAGIILQHLGLKSTGAIALGFIVIGAVLGAVSNSFGLMLTSRVLEGIGAALMAILAPTAIAMWFPPEKSGMPMGIWSTSTLIGGVTAMTVAPALEPSIGWRGVWWATAGFALMTFVVFWLFIRPAPVPEGANGSAPGAPPTKANMKSVFSNKNLWLVGVAMLFFNLSFIPIVTYYPIFLQTNLGFAMREVGFTVVLVSLTWIPGAPLAGWISDVTRSRKWVIIAGFVLLVPLVVFMFQLPEGMVVLFMILFGLCASAISPAIFAAAPETLGEPKFAGMSLAIVTLFMKLGAILGPVIFYVLVDYVGWGTAGYACVVALILGIVVVLMNRELR